MRRLSSGVCVQRQLRKREGSHTHYAQRLSCAAVAEDAKIINRGARSLRQRATRVQGIPA